ncbi:hypothetical protein G7Z17_g7224 [Cylindrodendrum hubeiense]|uniref:chitinase n=1 Tax=Cylindrodendrum hubeiense TaxID=595255 RepID=A0A9P5H9F8_9HYPO|nr:hypothetical protein G7Z17_g7224 [Cylindrodendrum hubeiense]
MVAAAPTTRPKACKTNTDALTYGRRIAYYELFTKDRKCGVREPEDLPLAPLTHLNLAFVNFNSDFELEDTDSDWVKRTVMRKLKYPDLRINIAIGGWAFNDPPTSTYFSDMMHSYEGRATFIKSIISYLRKYTLDGVDIDWEYPLALDRGGTTGDDTAFVQFLGELKDAFKKEGSGWELSVTLPTSYWYLRGFRLTDMQENIDYFNLMSYDIHGMWDLGNDWTGPYLKGHTNWTEIDRGLDLLWRNDIKPENVVLGFAFYGRSFTLADSSCHQPNGICKFATGGTRGTCSGEAGILTYDEIASRNSTLDVATFYDPETTVKYNAFGGDQWISYDDGQSFHDKLVHLSERCLSGLMVWAIDQDSGNWTAMNQLFGDFSDLQLSGMKTDSKVKLKDMFGQFTGQDCLVTPHCTDGSDGESKPEQMCPPGYDEVDIAHDPKQTYPYNIEGRCKEGWFRRICCPEASVPKNCEWNGAPDRSQFGCTGKCGEGTFQLNEDTYMDAEGDGKCNSGSRKLCCQGTKVIEDCFWNKCEGPLARYKNPSCPDGYEYQTYRFNSQDGSGMCADEYVSPVDGSLGSPVTEAFKSALCCPKDSSYSNCNWSNDPAKYEYGVLENICFPQPCERDQLEIADALDPPVSPQLGGGRTKMSCDSVSLPSGYDDHFGYCCDPPSTWNKNWPVDPEKLWDIHFNDPKTDKAVWQYDSQYSYNNADSDRSEDEDGDDAYGFVMLNGEKEAIDDEFGDTHTIVSRSALPSKRKREILTTNQTTLDNVFEHAEETLYVYCNYPPGSDKCNAVWSGGVEDTIIRLPAHVGEGPFARVVHMREANKNYKVPKHHLDHRSFNSLHDNPVYELKIDYNFHLVRDDRGPVQIRVDYTNLLGYWDEMTNDEDTGKSSRLKRRTKLDDEFTMKHFQGRVKRGEEADKKRGKRNAKVLTATVPFELEPESGPNAHTTDVTHTERSISKRWWGEFKEWISRLTSVRKGEKGDLPLEWADEINLFEAKWGCPGKTWSANLRMDLQAEMTMQATYAYYYSGTFIPPSKPDVFFYFGIEPEATLMLKLEGNAEMRYKSQRKKIIDTIGYPGLAVKGIAAVGPTLDVYGQVKGFINIHGEAKAGATVSFGKSQAYWPQDDDAINKYDNILDLGLKESPDIPPGREVAPTFEAGVQVKAELDVIIQPEANVGIKIGGGKWTGGRALVDAQITAYMRGILQFWATGKVTTTSKSFDYQYAAYFYYNLGYKAKATVLEWSKWALGERSAYPSDRQVTLYKQNGSIPLTADEKKRSIDLVTYGNDTLGLSELGDDSLFRRANADDDDDGSNMSLDPNKPQFSSNVKCPAGSSTDITIPELRFNCAAFPPISIVGINGQPYLLEDMCKGYKTVSNLPMTLTHAAGFNDQQNKLVEKRRGKQCPTGYCAPLTKAFHAGVGYTGSKRILECDEFPWGSSDEGGDFKDNADRSQLCVPSFQNGLGGACINMMSHLRSNVGMMDPSVKDDEKEKKFVKWGSYSKLDSGTPSDAEIWYTDGKKNEPAEKSWMFKRNYTFSIMDDGAQAKEWWTGATAKKFQKPGPKKKPTQFRDATGYASVICAVNIFGQTDYYQNPKQGGTPEFNAMCYTDKQEDKNGWPQQYTATRCLIDFAPAAPGSDSDGGDDGDSQGGSDTKRSTNDGWKINNVIMYDDNLDLTDPDALPKLLEREAREERETEEKARRDTLGLADLIAPPSI